MNLYFSFMFAGFLLGIAATLTTILLMEKDDSEKHEESPITETESGV